MTERLQKILARAGIASRRHAEDLISAGRVQVNGRQASLGDSASDTDRITVDGQPVSRATSHVTFALYKPRGTITTASDEYGRRNILDLVPVVPGLHPVGRLDRDSEGLILLTTDGDLTLELTHPRYEHEKEYRVWTDPGPSTAQLQALERGVTLEDGPAKASRVKLAPEGAWITVHEGRNRLVRRMFEAVHLEVVRLRRVRFGSLEIGDLRPREWRELEPWEVENLKRRPGVAVAKRSPRPAPAARDRATRRG